MQGLRKWSYDFAPPIRLQAEVFGSGGFLGIPCLAQVLHTFFLVLASCLGEKVFHPMPLLLADRGAWLG